MSESQAQLGVLEKAHIAEPYETLEQQQSAATLGMWTFLATEVLFFGGLFMCYTLYRAVYPEVVAAAGRELNIRIGSINTGVLLTSSFFVACAVKAAEEGKRKLSSRLLLSTVVLGIVFLCLKGYEYYDDVEKHIVATTQVLAHGVDEPVTRLFYLIYYLMTGLHALHVTIGVCVLSVIWRKSVRGEFSEAYYTPVEVAALYWHFVDLVWIFLYPLLYLMARYR